MEKNDNAVNTEKQTTYTVYAIHNSANDKVYIGLTSHRYSIRKATHRYKFKKGTHENSDMGMDAKKYGVESFEFTVLFVSPDKQHAEQMEEYFIKAFDSTNPQCGYNRCSGGYSKFSWSEQTHQRRNAAIQNTLAKTWPSLIRPDGSETGPIWNLRAFCRETGCNYQMLLRLYRGDAKKGHVKGWRVAN